VIRSTAITRNLAGRPTFDQYTHSKNVAEAVVVVAIDTPLVHLCFFLLGQLFPRSVSRPPNVPLEGESEHAYDPEPKRGRVAEEVARSVGGTVNLSGDP
jgi:hypothetical protein